MEAICESFPPVADAGCRALILGSMPGVASLAAAQYYAHPRNAFWPILYALFAEEAPLSDKAPSPVYAERLSFALAHRVAIWDVAKRCARKGSSDSAMRDVAVNDFEGFFRAYPEIQTVFFNGKAAFGLFERLAKGAAGERGKVLLPSTSPAFTMGVWEKLEKWRVLRKAGEGG